MFFFLLLNVRLRTTLKTSLIYVTAESNGVLAVHSKASPHA